MNLCEQLITDDSVLLEKKIELIKDGGECILVTTTQYGIDMFIVSILSVMVGVLLSLIFIK